MKNVTSTTCQPLFATVINMILLFFLPLMYSFHFVATKNEVVVHQTFQQPEKSESTALQLKPFKFNPNNISESELNRMGLPDKVVSTILMFRSKGGTFRKAEDLNKIYGITDNIFQKLKPYIEL